MIYCLSWINAVWEQLLICCSFTKRHYGSRSLPDEILVEILSRLPAESVLEFRSVCKHWNSLTSTPDFTKKHLNNASPAVLIAKSCPGRKEDLLLMNEWGVPATKGAARSLRENIKRSGPKKSICPVPLSSQNFTSTMYYNNGLLLFQPEYPLILPCDFKSSDPLRVRSHIVYNPVTREKLVLNTYGGYICACFYHPLAREYRLIWHRWQGESLPIEFKMLNLGSPTEALSWRRLANFDHLPQSRVAPVLINEALHWMILDCEEISQTQQPCCSISIIMFDINREEFSTMAHPGDECNMSWRRHKYMYLLELKLEFGSGSLLCFCDCSMQDQIEMWVLEDYEKRVWMRRHRIVYGLDVVDRIPFAIYGIVPFGLQNGEMLIHSKKMGVFAYNLNKSSMRKINELISTDIGNIDNKITYVGMHQKSLVSFTNFKQQGLHFTMGPG